MLLVIPYLYAKNTIDFLNFTYYEEITLSLLLTSLAITYLSLKKYKLTDMPKELGLSQDKLTPKMLLYGFLIFFMIFALELFIGLLQPIIGISINTNSNLLLAGSPLWFMLFVTVIGPINEEIMFRGLLVPRIGIILSALIFGILHLGYGSTFAIDVIAAFIFGLISGYVYKKTGSLYPSLTAHILVNLFAVVIFIL
jgi:membrane protease YdiL (CAAX protease family)